MRVLALLALVVLVAQAAAHHPGSNHGLALIEDERLVHRLPDVQAKFAAWNTNHPDFVERFVIGQTTAGFPLEGIRVTDEAVAFDEAATATGTKLRVYLDGGHHGNEYLGVELVMYYLEEFLATMGDERVTAFLQETELYAVPMLSVEGNFLDTRKNGRQVDVNRNYDFQWGGPGSSNLLLAPTYRGSGPASEPEVAANQKFAAEIRPDLWITMHTGVAEFYWPWGWTHDQAPDWEFFESIEAPFENATNGRVDAMQAAELYLAAGATDDWAYGVLGVPAHTFEVHEDQFVPVYGETIPAIIQEQLAGLDWVVKNVKRWGAWLEVHVEGDQLVIRNEGWNTATGIRVVDGPAVPDIRPGAEARIPYPTAKSLEYQQMLINTSKVRVVSVPEAPLVLQEAQTTPLPLLLVAAALGLAVRRRRNS